MEYSGIGKVYWEPSVIQSVIMECSSTGTSSHFKIIRKEGNILFNDAFNTLYLWLYGVGYMVKDHSDTERGRKEMFYLTMHSTHFYLQIYGIGHGKGPFR